MKFKDAFKRLGRTIRPFICQDNPEEQESRTHETRNQIEPAQRSATQQKFERTSPLEVARPVPDVQVVTAEPTEDVKDNDVQGSNVQDGRAQEQWSNRTNSVNSQRVLPRPGQRHDQAEGQAEKPPANLKSSSKERCSQSPAEAHPQAESRMHGVLPSERVAESAGPQRRPARSSQKKIGSSSGDVVSQDRPKVAVGDSQPRRTYRVYSNGVASWEDARASFDPQAEQKLKQAARGATQSGGRRGTLTVQARAPDVLRDQACQPLEPTWTPADNVQPSGIVKPSSKPVLEGFERTGKILGLNPVDQRHLLDIHCDGIIQELNQDHLTNTFTPARRRCVLRVIWQLHHIGRGALLHGYCETELETNALLKATLLALAKYGKALEQRFIQLWEDLHLKISQAPGEFAKKQLEPKKLQKTERWLAAYMDVPAIRPRYGSDVQQITNDSLADESIEYLRNALKENAPESEPLLDGVLRYQPLWVGDGEWPSIPVLPADDSTPWLNDSNFDYREFEEAMS